MSLSSYNEYASTQTNINIRQKLLHIISFQLFDWFTWTFLMAYSKAKLTSSDAKASTLFHTNINRNLLHRCLPISTYWVQVSIKHILIGPCSFKDTLNENVTHNVPLDRYALVHCIPTFFLRCLNAEWSSSVATTVLHYKWTQEEELQDHKFL